LKEREGWDFSHFWRSGPWREARTMGY